MLEAIRYGTNAFLALLIVFQLGVLSGYHQAAPQPLDLDPAENAKLKRLYLILWICLAGAWILALAAFALRPKALHDPKLFNNVLSAPLLFTVSALNLSGPGSKAIRKRFGLVWMTRLVVFLSGCLLFASFAMLMDIWSEG